MDIVFFTLIFVGVVALAWLTIAHNYVYKKTYAQLNDLSDAIYFYNLGVLYGVIDVDPVLGRNLQYDAVLMDFDKIFSIWFPSRVAYKDKEKFDAVMKYHSMFSRQYFERMKLKTEADLRYAASIETLVRNPIGLN